MTTNDNLFFILVSEIEQKLNDNKAKNDIVDKLKIAMYLAKNHWLITDPDVQFRGAVGGVMIHYGKESEEFEKLEWELQQLRKLEITIKAAKEGLSTSFNIIGDNQFTPIGLLKLWRETK